MGSTARLALRTIGAAAIALGGVVVALAIALVVSVWSVKVDCPSRSSACGEGRPLSVIVATPIVLIGLTVAGAGWFALRAGREKR